MTAKGSNQMAWPRPDEVQSFRARMKWVMVRCSHHWRNRRGRNMALVSR